MSPSCGSAGKESACNVGDLDLTSCVGNIPWRRERLPTPVFWPGDHKESDTTERHSLSLKEGVVKIFRQNSVLINIIGHLFNEGFMGLGKNTSIW